MKFYEIYKLVLTLGTMSKTTVTGFLMTTILI